MAVNSKLVNTQTKSYLLFKRLPAKKFMLKKYRELRNKRLRTNYKQGRKAQVELIKKRGIDWGMHNILVAISWRINAWSL